MNATIHPFPPQGDSPDLPSLEEMCCVLWDNRQKLDDVDRDFFAFVNYVSNLEDKAKIETIIECRAIAWSMMNRYGVKV